MKTFVVLVCAIMCIGYIQTYSIPPERPGGHPPPLWDESLSQEDETTETEVGDMTESPDAEVSDMTESPETEDDVTEVPTTEEPAEDEVENVNNATLVKMCVQMLLNGEIEISQPAHSATPSPMDPSAPTHTASEQSTTPTATTEPTSTAETTVTTTKATGPAMLFSCNFEHGWCGIQQDTAALRLNWTLGRSDVAPPSGAYSGKHYLITEAEDDQNRGDATILIPKLDLDEMGSEVCLQFKYRISENHMGLKAYLERAYWGMTSRLDLSDLSGDQGGMGGVGGTDGDQGGTGGTWHHAQVSFYAADGDVVGFSVSRGKGSSGHVDLDDVVVTSRFCDGASTNT